jgi:hypothetical protein
MARHNRPGSAFLVLTQLAQVARTGGVVVDPDGNPVKTAEVEFGLPIERKCSAGGGFDRCAFRAYADENGCWSCEYIPVESLKKAANIRLSVSHPDWRTTSKSGIDVAKLKRNESGIQLTWAGTVWQLLIP